MPAQGKLTFDSVYRFKDQEAPAVILVHVDPRPDRALHYDHPLYCGMTRATNRLDLVVRLDNAEYERLVMRRIVGSVTFSDLSAAMRYCTLLKILLRSPRFEYRLSESTC